MRNTGKNATSNWEKERPEKRTMDLMDILPHLTFSGFPSRRQDIHASANALRAVSSISEMRFSRAKSVKLVRGPAPSVFRQCRLVRLRVPCSATNRCRHFARVSLVDCIRDDCIMAPHGECFVWDIGVVKRV